VAFEHTSVMFRASERLIESLGLGKTQVPRTLRVGLTGSVARSTSSDFLMPLLAIDDCIPTIRFGDAAELIRELRGSELDVVLCESEPPEAGLRGLEVAIVDRTSLVAIAPPSVVPTNDWHDIRLLQYRTSSSYRWEVETYLHTRELRPRIAAEVDDAVFLLEAATRGGYVAFVPRSIARDAIAAGRVRIIATIDASYCGVYAAYQDSTSADLARRAVELLIEHARTSQAD
jgi:DNA-binding transcriptional LysR family regulator